MTRKPVRTRDSNPQEAERIIAENYRLVLAWSSRMHAKGYFSGWTPDDIASCAYIAAVELVDEKFDPKRGRLSTFLFTRLYSRVRYQWAADRGLRWNRAEKTWVPRNMRLDELLNLDEPHS